MVKVMQLEITLNGSKPRIWRRFQVEENITFLDLHYIIQTIMGWSCSHLYIFDIDGLELGDSGPYDKSENPEKYKLSKLLEKGMWFKYTYDFGDDWEHIIKVEDILKKEDKKYPLVIKGKNACPPEDVGGIWGYADFLEATSDKNHPRHKEMKEWYDFDFDPKKFNLEIINKELQN